LKLAEFRRFPAAILLPLFVAVREERGLVDGKANAAFRWLVHVA